MSHYFLTGATGAVGSAIVPLLLEDPECQVSLLIRAESDVALAKRLEDLFAFWGWDQADPKRSHVLPLRGDAAEPQFGLASQDYEALVSRTTHIIHCAASVRMNYPLEEARRSAVGSAEQILALGRRIAEQGSLQKIEFVSTVGIAGKRQGILPETWITEPREFHNTYEQSKAEAEMLVKAAIEEEGLPITVHRPSMVIGDSRTGKIIHFQIFYFICEFLSGRKTFGLYPDFGDVRLDIIPVDHVARAIAESSCDPNTAGRIFNLCAGPDLAPRLRDLMIKVQNVFRAHGIALPRRIRLPHRVFALLPSLASRFTSRSRRKALATLPLYLDYLADQQGFGNDLFVKWRNETGHLQPQPAHYLDAILSAYLGGSQHMRD